MYLERMQYGDFLLIFYVGVFIPPNPEIRAVSLGRSYASPTLFPGGLEGGGFWLVGLIAGFRL